MSVTATLPRRLNVETQSKPRPAAGIAAQRATSKLIGTTMCWMLETWRSASIHVRGNVEDTAVPSQSSSSAHGSLVVLASNVAVTPGSVRTSMGV